MSRFNLLSVKPRAGKPKICTLVFLVCALACSALGQSRSDKGREAEAVALTNLGFNYSKSGQHNKAVEVLSRAIQLQPDLAEAHYFLGGAYNNIDLHGESVREFKEAIRLKPGWVEAYSALGVAYNCLKRFD
ncbi:MAG TPA: tetratricopeptide repeat protein, partial [Pyrinomonadaceae bacterium]